MSRDNPAVILYDAYGKPLAVRRNEALPADTPALVIAGVNEDDDVRFLQMSDLGKPRVLDHGAYINGYTPEPYMNRPGTTEHMHVDWEHQLMIRGPVLTDEASFRDDFIEDTPYTLLTGTVIFTEASDVIEGSGTVFTEEVQVGHYILKATDIAAQVNTSRVRYVIDDEHIQLEEPYEGTTGSTTGAVQNWKVIRDGGATVTRANSCTELTVGTASGDKASGYREADYLPFSVRAKAKLSQRIANQVARFGLANEDSGVTAFVEISGDDQTSIDFVTSSGYNAIDVERTSIPLTLGRSVLTFMTYQVDLLAGGVTLTINDVVVATHKTHVPGPYDYLDLFGSIENEDTAASGTTFYIDYMQFQNFNQVEVGKSGQSDPLKVVVMSSAAGIPGYTFGNCASSGTSAQYIMETAYTEPTSGSSAKEILSASANDTSAGTGARSVRITYFDDNMDGPYLLEVALNGTTPVAISATDMRYIEKMEVISVGSGGANAGIITLRHTGGTTIGTVALGRNRTNWLMHYVARGRVCNITGMMYGCQGSAGGLGYLTAKAYSNTTDPIVQITEYIRAAQDASRQRNFATPLQISGPARIRGWCIPDTNNMTQSMSFEYYEQVT